ncbi:MAG: type II toxin-antitoxin system Phd/YefM family antitoxin [Deltaproteobacteria bacterium]|nr:type II toxin-antitoxin system Phd/YefM family antitoxin [Deltaproteobacteria bacterium]
MIASVHEAKTHLSRLLQRVEAGEEVLIRRGDTVVARLVACNPGPNGRVFGAARGLYPSPPPDAFDALTEPELADWEGQL